MEGYCSTGQSPQWAVVPVEEEEEEGKIFVFSFYYSFMWKIVYTNLFGVFG
jgi:hypothetical protein